MRKTLMTHLFRCHAVKLAAHAATPYLATPDLPEGKRVTGFSDIGPDAQR